MSKTIDPATLAYTDLTSSNQDEQFPIMSISKSFCGAVCALMAADGKFGEQGLKTTLYAALQAAKENPAIQDRHEKIDGYLLMLESKGLTDITIEQILNHRHGNRIPDTMLPPEVAAQYKADNKLAFFEERLPTNAQHKTDFSYSNTAYELLEEVINLTSDNGSYLNELRERVLNPLNIADRTGAVTTSNEAMEKVGKIDCPAGFKTPYGQTYDKDTSYVPTQLHPGQQGSLTAGALCSTIHDMSIYSVELAKMITGQDSLLTTNKTANQKQQIVSSYRKAVVENNPPPYSLGLAIMDDEQGTTIAKGGRFPGNKANMVIRCPKSEDRYLEPQISELYMQERAFVVDSSPFSGVNYLYQNALKDYFKEIDPELAQSFTKGNEGGNHWRGDLDKWRDALIEQGKLPENFRNLQGNCCEEIQEIVRSIDPKTRTLPEMDKFTKPELDYVTEKMCFKLSPEILAEPNSKEFNLVKAIAKGYGMEDEKFDNIASKVNAMQLAKKTVLDELKKEFSQKNLEEKSQDLTALPNKKDRKNTKQL